MSDEMNSSLNQLSFSVVMYLCEKKKRSLSQHHLTSQHFVEFEKKKHFMQKVSKQWIQ